MSSHSDLNSIEKRLISIAASIAAGCKACTAITIRDAREADASEEEIKQAVMIGLEVKNNAYHEIVQETRKHVEIMTKELIPHKITGATKLDQLLATGAAFAASFTIGVEQYSAVAEQLGASENDLIMVIEIARRIKEQTGIETEKTAAMVVPIKLQEESASSDCGCNTESEEETTNCCS